MCDSLWLGRGSAHRVLGGCRLHVTTVWLCVRLTMWVEIGIACVILCILLGGWL